MPIQHNQGSTTITGDSIAYLRLVAMRGAVGLECHGIKVRRGPVIWKQAAREFGIKGDKHAVKAWLDAKVAEERAKQEHIENGIRTVAGERVQ